MQFSKQIPNRKPNRVKSYDYSQCGAYFITICTTNWNPVLSTIVEDGFPVPKFSGTIAEQYIHKIPKKYPNVSIDNYVIMPDHTHLILYIDAIHPIEAEHASPTIGNIIGWYKYQVTKQYNLSHRTTGQKLFQRSHYDHVIRNQQDYNEIWEYIENNPQNWIQMKRSIQNSPSEK